MIWIKAACLCRRSHSQLAATASRRQVLPPASQRLGSLTLGLLCGKLQCWTTWSSSAKSNFVLFFRLRRRKLGSLIRNLVLLFYDWIRWYCVDKNWFWPTSNFVIYWFCSAFKNKSIFSLVFFILPSKAIFYIVCSYFNAIIKLHLGKITSCKASRQMTF